MYPAESGTSETERIISKSYEDSFGRVVRSYESGLYTDMTYNMQGDMVTKLSMGKTADASKGILELYIYNEDGHLTETIINPGYEANAETTGFYIKEDEGDIEGSTVIKAEYDKAGNVISETDALGNKTAYSYDEAGQLTSVTLPDEIKGTLSDIKYVYSYDEEYEEYATKDTVTDPNGNISIVVKDSLDQTIEVADIGAGGENVDKIATQYSYDIKGNLTKVQEEEGNYKEYTYDSHDRVTAIDYYKSEGNKTLRTEFTYDNSDNLLSMEDYTVSGEDNTLYRYTKYEYDDLNRLASVAELDTSTEPTEDQIEAKMITYSYDIRDNLTEIRYPDMQMGVLGMVFTYDKVTNLVTKAEAVTEYETDDEGEEKVKEKKTVREYTYNDMNLVSEMKDYTNFLTDSSKFMTRTYGYDHLNRPVIIEYRDNITGDSSEVKEGHYYSYDKNNNITKERTVNYYGKANGASFEQTREYVYDHLNRLVATNISTKEDVSIESESEEGSEGEEESDSDSKEEHISYEYDNAGNRTKVTENGEVTTYEYNGFNQITSSETKKQAEGVEGNEEGESAEVESTSTIISEKTFTYDKNGNQISENETVTEGETPSTVTSTFSYDADNRLVSAEGKTGDTVDYTQNNEYNGFGQRIKKTEGTEETNYFYDGTSVLYTTNAEGNKTAFNIIGAEDNILSTVRYDGDAVSFYTYTKDLRESTVNLIGSDGTAKVSYEYSDYGETEIFGDDTFYNEVCHGAGIYDKTTGLYYLNARHYDPEDAIFMSQDTYRGDRSRTATLNYYAYCAGNPINYTDPSGHAFWGIIGAAMGAYDGYKYAKKKKLKGWKKAAAIVGGAALGAVNPCKVAKAAKKVYKFAKSARKAYKAAKTAKKAKKIAKASKAKKLKSYKKVNNKTKVKTKNVSNKAKKKVSKTNKKILTDSEAERLAIAATKGPEESKFVVLGRYEKDSASSYDEVAKEIRAQYFHLENYDELIKNYDRDEIWKINKKFIDRQIDSGRTIVLSHDPTRLKMGTFYREEIMHLSRRGYKFSKSGGLWYAHK